MSLRLFEIFGGIYSTIWVRVKFIQKLWKFGYLYGEWRNYIQVFLKIGLGVWGVEPQLREWRCLAAGYTPPRAL